MYQSLAGRKASLVSGLIATIALAATVGKLKNGESAPYIDLTTTDGSTVHLHPRKAQTLFTKGEVDGIKLLVEAVAVVDQAGLQAAEAASAPVVKKVTKKQLCVDIFEDVLAKKGTRQECIQRFMAEAGLSLHGSNTYYQSCRNGSYS